MEKYAEKRSTKELRNEIITKAGKYFSDAG
jgi:hypothetical protein